MLFKKFVDYAQRSIDSSVSQRCTVMIRVVILMAIGVGVLSFLLFSLKYGFVEALLRQGFVIVIFGGLAILLFKFKMTRLVRDLVICLMVVLPIFLKITMGPHLHQELIYLAALAALHSFYPPRERSAMLGFSLAMVLGYLVAAYLDHFLEAGVTQPTEDMMRWSTLVTDLSVAFVVGFVILGSLFSLRRQGNEFRAQAAKRLEDAKMVALGETAQGATNGINNAIQIIMGLAEQGEDALIQKDWPDFKPLLKKILHHSDRTAKIVGSLRLYSRDRSDDPLIPYSAHELVSSATDLTHQRFVERDIEFQVDIDLHETMLCRPGEALKVLITLINNAIDAVDFVANPRIEIKTHGTKGDFVEIHVQNNGAAIGEDEKSMIFEAFYSTKSEKKFSRGFGLAIAKVLVQRQGGSIELSRSDESGSVFVLRFQRAPEKSQVA